MGWLFESPSVKIEAPPAPPAAPGLSPQEQEILDLERQLGDLNLEIQREQRAQETATRTALETAFGKPLADVFAEQAVGQNRLLTGLQTGQEANLALQLRAIAQAEAEREAFTKATGMTPEEAAAQEAVYQQRIRGPLQERFERGLRGELPVSPALSRSLDEQEQLLHAKLREQFGPGYETPGSPALPVLLDFAKRRIELETASREGAISEAEQIGFSLMPSVQRALGARGTAVGTSGPLGAAIGSTNPLAAILPFSQRSMFQTPEQFGRIQGTLAGQRAFEFAPQMTGYQNQANFANMVNQAQIGAAGARAQAQGGLLGSLVGTGGTLGAAYMMRNQPRYTYPWPSTNFQYQP